MDQQQWRDAAVNAAITPGPQAAQQQQSWLSRLLFGTPPPPQQTVRPNVTPLGGGSYSVQQPPGTHPPAPPFGGPVVSPFGGMDQSPLIQALKRWFGP